MKRTVGIIFVAVMAIVCLAACGSSEKCRKCDEDVFKDGYCKKHYFENYAESLVEGLLTGIKDVVGDVIGNPFGEIPEGIGSGESLVGSDLRELTGILDSFPTGEDSAAFDSIKEKAQDFLENEIDPDDDEETVKEKIREALGSVKENMDDEFEGLKQDETNELKNAIDEILKMF